MSLAFPLSRSVFFDLLRAPDVPFDCAAQNQVNGLGGGEILSARVGSPRWAGSVSLAPVKAREAAPIQAMLELLELEQGSFRAYKKNQIGPASDPVGAALAGHSPQVLSVDAAAGTLRLSGLPAGYELRHGDLLSFGYDGGRQALHRIQGLAVADAQGDTPAFRVTPRPKPGVAIGESVELLRSWCIAKLVPTTVRKGTTKFGITRGIQFDFRQSLMRF